MFQLELKLWFMNSSISVEFGQSRVSLPTGDEHTGMKATARIENGTLASRIVIGEVLTVTTRGTLQSKTDHKGRRRIEDVYDLLGGHLFCFSWPRLALNDQATAEQDRQGWPYFTAVQRTKIPADTASWFTPCSVRS